MGRRSKKSRSDQPDAVRHPLLVYRNLGRRYRSPGVLLIIAGALLFLPSFVSDLESEAVEPSVLALLGVALILVGLAFWLFARLAMQRAYVQVRPDLLVIHTPFYRVDMSYRRIKQIQPVQVSQLFPRDSLKGMGGPLMRPLLGMTAVEMHVRSWPKPKKRLQRFLSQYLFSPRAEAWVFIVPNYSILTRQVDTALQNKADVRRRVATGYQDPFERLGQ